MAGGRERGKKISNLIGPHATCYHMTPVHVYMEVTMATYPIVAEEFTVAAGTVATRNLTPTPSPCHQGTVARRTAVWSGVAAVVMATKSHKESSDS